MESNVCLAMVLVLCIISTCSAKYDSTTNMDSGIVNNIMDSKHQDPKDYLKLLFGSLSYFEVKKSLSAESLVTLKKLTIFLEQYPNQISMVYGVTASVTMLYYDFKLQDQLHSHKKMMEELKIKSDRLRRLVDKYIEENSAIFIRYIRAVKRKDHTNAEKISIRVLNIIEENLEDTRNHENELNFLEIDIRKDKSDNMFLGFGSLAASLASGAILSVVTLNPGPMIAVGATGIVGVGASIKSCMRHNELVKILDEIGLLVKNCIVISENLKDHKQDYKIAFIKNIIDGA